MKERQEKHQHTEHKGKPDAIGQCLIGPVVFGGADILRDECRHRLHKCTRYQHDEAANLLRDADAGTRIDTEPVDDRHDDEEGHADQEVLQCDGEADREDPLDDFHLRTERMTRKRKGKRPATDKHQRDDHRKKLREHRRKSRACRTHMKHGNEIEISENICDARDTDCHERRLRITKSPENTAEDVIRDDD